MFGFSIRFWKIGIVVLQHFLLIAVAQLAAERAMLGATLAIGLECVVFQCALAYSFVRTSRWNSSHNILHRFGIDGLIAAPSRWLAGFSTKSSYPAQAEPVLEI